MKKMFVVFIMIIILHILEILLVYSFAEVQRYIEKKEIFLKTDFYQMIGFYFMRLFYFIVPQYFIFLIIVIFTPKMNINRLIIINVCAYCFIAVFFLLFLGSLEEFLTREITYYFLIASILSPIILSIFPFFRTMVLKLNEPW